MKALRSHLAKQLLQKLQERGVKPDERGNYLVDTAQRSEDCSNCIVIRGKTYCGEDSIVIDQVVPNISNSIVINDFPSKFSPFTAVNSVCYRSSFEHAYNSLLFESSVRESRRSICNWAKADLVKDSCVRQSDVNDVSHAELLMVDAAHSITGGKWRGSLRMETEANTISPNGFNKITISGVEHTEREWLEMLAGQSSFNTVRPLVCACAEWMRANKGYVPFYKPFPNAKVFNTKMRSRQNYWMKQMMEGLDF